MIERNELRAKWQRLRQPQPQPCLTPEQLPFPTEAQLDLLKAALLPADQAAAAWQRWKSRGLRLEIADADSIRMFSQLWTNRDAAGIVAADLPILKGVYRKVLARNAVELSSALDAAQLLTAAGIPVLFFKGAAMIARTGLLGLRHISDVDVLIPEADARRAIALLMAAGYASKPGCGDFRIGNVHSWDCISASGSHLDVHWWAFKTAGDDSSMFETAREGTLLGRTVMIPSATESLVTVIANAFHSHPAAPMRWIADAMLLFEAKGESIEWDILLERARRPGVTLGLASGLDFLAREFGAPVPAEVLTELRSRPVNWRERGAHWAAVKHRRSGTVLANDLLQHHARRLHYPNDVPQDVRGYLTQDLGIAIRATGVTARRSARAVIVGLIRFYDVAVDGARRRTTASRSRPQHPRRAANPE